MKSKIDKALVEFLNDLAPVLKKHKAYIIANSKTDEFAEVGFQILSQGLDDEVNRYTNRCHFGGKDAIDLIYKMKNKDKQ